MRAYVIVEGRIYSTIYMGNPVLIDVGVCETGFLTEGDAVQSLINTGWVEPPWYVKFNLGSNAWVRPEEEEREEDQDGPINMVRYVAEVEIQEGP